jgi:hypothetical protein
LVSADTGASGSAVHSAATWSRYSSLRSTSPSLTIDSTAMSTRASPGA